MHTVSDPRPASLTWRSRRAALVLTLAGSAVAGAAALAAAAPPPKLDRIQAPPAFVPVEPLAPDAVLRLDTHLGHAPLTVRFDASATTNPTGSIATWRWDFGDGTVDRTARPTHVFATPGHYVVTLTVTNEVGFSSTDRRVISVAPGPYTFGGSESEAEARRFLWQAAWGAGEHDVAFVMANGFEAWIDEQMGVAGNHLTRALMDAHEASGSGGPSAPSVWEDICIGGDDQLRQRLAWALVQIIAINGRRGGENIDTLYQIYTRHALPEASTGSNGNYRELLEEVTYHEAMGAWLTYDGNRKENPDAGTKPDENYAREIMQLFTVGLWMLEADGTRTRDVHGNAIPAYDTEYHVGQFARIFTGLRHTYDNEADVMSWRLDDHEFGEKQLLDHPGSPGGGYIPAAAESESNAVLDISAALDNLFDHPNTPPFIARQLIQRFVTSNPTPAYVARAAEAFAGDGPYGAGVRGDLAATIKAILLDDEARNPVYRANPLYGKLHEPLVLLLGTQRTFDAVRFRADGAVWPFRHSWYDWNSLQGRIGQAWVNTPSVFNFYRPDFAPPNTAFAKAGFASPETQIVTEVTALEMVDILDDIRQLPWWDPDTVDELMALAPDPAALVFRMDMMLHWGATSPEVRQIIIDTVATDPDLDDRIEMAYALLAVNVERRVLR